MSRERIPRRLVLGSGPGFAGLLLALAAWGQDGARPAGPSIEAIPPHATKARPYVFGAQTCTGCHDAPAKGNALCRMIESTIWQARDPHRQSLAWGRRDDPASWTSEAAKRAWAIGERLGLGDVTTARECIGCHSVGLTSEVPRQSFDALAEGVTCVACHGSYRDWVLEHQVTEDPEWRSRTRAEKWQRTGMVDLWDPVRRAEICLSCHVGDADLRAGKRLGHDMYAAGHPPLPGIEVETFCEQEPKHWLDLHAKSPTVARERLGFDPTRFEHTEQVAAGGLVALGRTAELMAAEAGPGGTWPEFARFDCLACHQDLRQQGQKTDPWKGQRRPGRPVEPAWTRAIAAAALEAIDPTMAATRNAELGARLSALHEALTARPLGERPAAAAAAQALALWVRGPLGELSAMAAPRREGDPAGRRIDAAAALRMVRSLGAAAARGPHDPESARQLAWAYRVVYFELLGRASELPEVQGNQLRAGAERSRRLLGTIDAELGLVLREPFDPERNETESTPDATGPRPLIDAYLGERLKRARDYDRGRFGARFTELMELLPNP